MRFLTKFILFLCISNLALTVYSFRKGIDKVKKGLNFILKHFTNKDKSQYVKLYLDTVKHKNIEIAPLHPTQLKNEKIFILIPCKKTSTQELSNILLKKYPRAQIIRVSYKNIARSMVGKIIAYVIQKFVDLWRINLKNIAIIDETRYGFVSKCISKQFYELTHLKLAQVISIEPPEYVAYGDHDEEIEDESFGITKDDVNSLVIIHNDNRERVRGTVDFYPMNTGCESYNSPAHNDISKGNSGNCLNLFMRSIQAPKTVTAHMCTNPTAFENKSCMGSEVSLGDLEFKQPGVFYFDEVQVQVQVHNKKQESRAAKSKTFTVTECAEEKTEKVTPKIPQGKSKFGSIFG